jgi:transcriptional regulator with XRE-family HTH domain
MPWDDKVKILNTLDRRRGSEIMIDSRKTGAFISKLRKQKDWTQLELANQLKVTHQAVSRWETGESFPDLGILVEIARLLGVRVDDLLSGDDATRSNSIAGSDLHEVWTALASEKPEEVAKLAVEHKESIESIIEAGPLTRPSLMEKVIKSMNTYQFNLEQVLGLAPFVDGETLTALFEKLGSAEINCDALVSLAPYLRQDLVDKVASQVFEPTFEGDKLISLAPFVSREVLASFIDKIQPGNIKTADLVSLAPFIDRKRLGVLLDQIPEEAIDPQTIVELAPFLEKETLVRFISRQSH